MKMSIARVVLAAAGLAALLSFPQLPAVRAADARFFELRIYHANPGKLDALNARFRNHTNKLFVKHGMELIGYWTPADSPEAQNTLVYILAYPSREAREASWKAFREDPAWIKAKDESEKGGVLVEKVDAKFMNPTDYSPLK
jgi:hypothetical protein